MRMTVFVLCLVCSSWSAAARTVPWSGGPPLTVTDATFVAEAQLVGSGGTDVLLAVACSKP